MSEYQHNLFDTNTNCPVVAVIEQDDATRNAVLSAIAEQGLDCWGAPSPELFYRRLFLEKTDMVVYLSPDSRHINFDAIAPLVEQPNIGIVLVANLITPDIEKEALLAGADYVLPKPLDTQLLVVSLYNLWRRIEKLAPETTQRECPEWQLDEMNNELVVDAEKRVRLSHQEFEFLSYLMRQSGAVVEKEELHRYLFPDVEELDAHRLAVLLNRVRDKVKKTGKRLPIRSLYGRGFAFVDNPNQVL